MTMLQKLTRTSACTVKKAFSAPRAIPANLRSFSSSRIVLGDDHHDARPPILQGPGAKPGTVPTDLDQATGIERYEILARMEGHDPFSRNPLPVTHMGTLENPVKVFSLERTRIVGCTGFPVDSHDTLYMKVTDSRPRRCPECRCAYIIDFQGDPNERGNQKPNLSILHEHPGEKPRLKWGWGDMPRHDGTNQR